MKTDVDTNLLVNTDSNAKSNNQPAKLSKTSTRIYLFNTVNKNTLPAQNDDRTKPLLDYLDHVTDEEIDAIIEKNNAPNIKPNELKSNNLATTNTGGGANDNIYNELLTGQSKPSSDGFFSGDIFAYIIIIIILLLDANAIKSSCALYSLYYYLFY